MLRNRNTQKKSITVNNSSISSGKLFDAKDIMRAVIPAITCKAMGEWAGTMSGQLGNDIQHSMDCGD